MTVEEFATAWEGEPDIRHEPVDGVAVTVNPPMSLHAAIVARTASELDARLRPERPRRALNEVGVWIGGSDCYVTDLAVTCSPIRNATHVEDLILIAEVPSAPTRA